MVYNNISVKQVITKVLTDNDMQEEVHRIADMLTWCAEAIERIGFFLNLDTKVTGKGGVPLLEVVNYQVQLPIGLHSIIQAAYSYTANGPYYPMVQGTGSFDSVRGITTTVGNTSSEDTNNATDFNTDITYVVTPGYIKTNKKDGYIMLAYSAIPISEDGFPLIPDLASYIDALYWYVTMKLMYPAWREGRIRDAVYYDARRSWNFYCKQAYGEALMPDSSAMESIKNTWNRLVPDMNANNSFYSTTNQQEIIYNANVPYGKGKINI